MRRTRNRDSAGGGGRSTLRVQRATQRAGGRLARVAGSQAARAAGAAAEACGPSTPASAVADFRQSQSPAWLAPPGQPLGSPPSCRSSSPPPRGGAASRASGRFAQHVGGASSPRPTETKLQQHRTGQITTSRAKVSPMAEPSLELEEAMTLESTRESGEGVNRPDGRFRDRPATLRTTMPRRASAAPGGRSRRGRPPC